MMTSFEVPRQKSIFKSLSYENVSNCINKITKNHNFTHAVNIAVPNSLQVPDCFKDENLNETIQYFIINQLPVHELTNKIFVEGFIKKGKLLCISHGTAIDRDDCICVSHTGHLILNLKKETYIQLGLPARKEKPKFLKKEQRYVVDLDMTEDIFTPGKKYYEHISQRLKELNIKFNVMLVWTPNDTNVYPSSVALYFKNKNYHVLPCRSKKNENTLYSILSPEITSNSVIDDTQIDVFHDFYEWLGMASCSCEMNPLEYVSLYCVPEPRVKFGQIVTSKLSGFLPHQFFASCLQSSRNFLQERSHIPWISLTIQGFQDSPIGSALNDHGFCISGDNILTFILFPDDKVWIFQAMDMWDRISI